MLVLWLACRVAAPPTHALPAPVCRAGTSWAPGTRVFRERTAAWGLTDIHPAGVRISAVDFDGDGWTDLAVRAGTAADDPAGTRQVWLMRNTGRGAFEDVTHTSGVLTRRDGNADLGRPGPVWAFADVDNDGDLDIYTGLPDAGSTETETSDLVLNQGDGTFALGKAGGDLGSDPDDQPYGATFADVDRDGFVDIFTGQYPVGSSYRSAQLLHNTGKGTFKDHTEKAGLETMAWTDTAAINAGLAHPVAWAVAACDLDLANGPELLVSSYGRAPNHLWHNDGAGSLANISVASGYAFDERTDWTDNESARCHCTLNPDDEDCSGVPAPTTLSCATQDDVFRWDHDTDREAFRLGGNSGATMCRDVDNDGRPDLLTSEIVHWDVGGSADPSELLFGMAGDAPRFERPGNEVTGLVRTHEDPVGWDDGDITGALFDFDLDGWTDVLIGGTDYPGNRALLYRQIAPRQFAAVDIQDGVDHVRSHGSAVADFDRDGDLDLVLGHSTARCYEDCYETGDIRLFENLLGDTANALKVRLEGTGGSNRSAIGARVVVTTESTTQMQSVSGAHGQWGAQDDLVLTFGLGAECSADVSVFWPDATASTEVHTLGAGWRYHLKQGETPVTW